MNRFATVKDREDHRHISKNDEGRLTARFRLLGLLPLVFFVAHALYYWKHGGLWHMLWMCNVGNLLLAAGLLLAQPILIRVAVIWLIPGLLLWGWFVVLQGGWLLTSTLAHVGGLLVGLSVMSRIRGDQKTWIYAFAWYLVVQQVCRLVTPAELNVNVAHRIYDGWEGSFTSYWEFWLLTTLIVVAGLWILAMILWKLWPPHTAMLAPDLVDAHQLKSR